MVFQKVMMFYHSITLRLWVLQSFVKCGIQTHSLTPSVLNPKLHPSHWMGVERNSKMDDDRISLSGAIMILCTSFFIFFKKKKSLYLLIKECLSLYLIFH
jgi:hypothetical protein